MRSHSASSGSNFIGDVVAKFLRHDGDDRLMELRDDFTFVDSSGRSWTAHRGFRFDGATIPRSLWTAFGDPFIGDYRRAAVIHDILCTPYCPRCGYLANDRADSEPRYQCPTHITVRPLFRVSSKEAAQIFYEAMRADGVTERRARIIQRTVANWGPQFDPPPPSERITTT